MCVTYDTAQQLNLLGDGWGVEELSEDCQSTLMTETAETVFNNVQWEHVFGNGDKSINRPVRDGWCSVGDTWGGEGDNVGTMFPSHLAVKPDGWYEIHRFNDTSSLGGDSQLFMGEPRCPMQWGPNNERYYFRNVGFAFANSVDELYNLDLSQYCCIPREVVRWMPIRRMRGHSQLTKLHSNRDKDGVCLYTGSSWGRQTPILAVEGCYHRPWVKISNHLLSGL